MDPNATVAELQALHADLTEAQNRDAGRDVLKGIHDAINERHRALLDWRRKGGFEPRVGWYRALSL